MPIGATRQYLEAFRECFRIRHWKHFVTVLLALIECKNRKTMTGMLRVNINHCQAVVLMWLIKGISVAGQWLYSQ
ncbi:MAG: hypothetical protein A2Z14_18900 [Chloroflexi bacterium RBG_16_48_8]|nr:MAG: hypothetical protein A2Z14_18900 [Chloroflexi bacterium RBG_16_48_8]